MGEHRGGRGTVTFNPHDVCQSPQKDEYAIVRTLRGAEAVVKVTREGFSEIEIAVDAPPLTFGDVVEVEYGGATMRAIVRRIEQRNDNSWLVGLRWT